MLKFEGICCIAWLDLCACAQQDTTARFIAHDFCRYKTVENQAHVATNSCTLYVGNLSFHTTEWQVYELFSRMGAVERVVMGLNRFSRRPCGFCFVMYVLKL